MCDYRIGAAHMRGAGVMRGQIMCATGDLTDSCARPSFGRLPCAAHCAGLREAAPCIHCAGLREAARSCATHCGPTASANNELHVRGTQPRAHARACEPSAVRSPTLLSWRHGLLAHAVRAHAHLAHTCMHACMHVMSHGTCMHAVMSHKHA